MVFATNHKGLPEEEFDRYAYAAVTVKDRLLSSH
jgi:hypothetical protein